MRLLVLGKFALHCKYSEITSALHCTVFGLISEPTLLCNCRSISTESIGKIFVILVHWNYLINL